MGKSFNDDIYNNRLNLDSINGLNISKEAIEENQQANKPKLDIDFNEIEALKTKIQNENKNKKIDQKEEAKQLLQEQERLQQKQQDDEPLTENQEPSIYVKKTMIFKQEYLDIIDGLATINDMQIKDVLNQLLSRAISELDIKVKK